MSFSVETKDDVEDLVVGTTILGTGGGGNPKTGREVLLSDLDAGRKIRIVTLDRVEEDSLIVSPYFVGSVAPGIKPSKAVTVREPFVVGLETVERLFRRKVAATVATELGGGNTAAALDVASRLGVPLIDGDLVGRAAPELHQSTAHIFGVSMAPSVVVSETGNVISIERYADIDDYEALARYVAVLAGGHASVIDTPLTKTNALKIVVRGTISEAMAVGKAVRDARQRDRDPVEAARGVLEGWTLFKGRVEKYEWKNEKGFLFGDVTLNGIEKWQGRSFRSWIKNEHIFAWRDNKPAVMPPDLIMFLKGDGHGVTNDALEPGLEVTVLGVRAPGVWRSERGLQFFGPRHFGFDFEYVPVEELAK